MHFTIDFNNKHYIIKPYDGPVEVVLTTENTTVPDCWKNTGYEHEKPNYWEFTKNGDLSDYINWTPYTIYASLIDARYDYIELLKRQLNDLMYKYQSIVIQIYKQKELINASYQTP